jgi:PAS domain S-box-containing protein
METAKSTGTADRPNPLDALRARLEELDISGARLINGALNTDAERLILSAIMDNLTDHIYFKDLRSRFVMVNRSLADRFGLKTPGEAVGKTDFDFFSEEHAKAAFDDEQDIIQTGRPIMNKEEKETWPDKPVSWVSSTKMPWLGPDGERIGTFGISRDITERKLAEEALHRSEEELRRHRDNLEELVREQTTELRAANEQLRKEMQVRVKAEQSLLTSEQRLRRLLAVSPTYVYTVTLRDGQPDTTEHSIGCLLVTGYTPEEYLRNPNLWIAMVHPDDRERVQRFVVKELAAGDSPPIEHRIVRKDGTVRWVRNTIVKHFDQQGRLVRYDGLVEDVTERRRAEEVLRDSERLKAIGNLADGVAVNFRNVMSIITSSAASIADHVIPSTPVHQDARRITEAARHADGLIRRLMSVARACDVRTDPGALQAVSLERTLRDIIELIGHAFTERNVRIVVKDMGAGSMPYAKADPDQLIDTLMNVFVNAAEAMPDGGTVEVHAERRRIESPRPRRNVNAKGGAFAVLSIRDTGVGIAGNILPRIFEPFFTTKTGSASFGLGLTVAENLVHGWGGWITVHSRPGAGTVFRIYIPEAPPPPVEAAEDAPLVIAGQTILLIDDDTDLLTTVGASLEQAGFRVLTASSARAGVATFSARSSEIAVTVVDMVMPDAPWDFAIEQIVKADPDANVVVTSGFSRDFVRRSLPRGSWGYLQKPFEPKHLADMVIGLIRRGISAIRQPAAPAK